MPTAREAILEYVNDRSVTPFTFYRKLLACEGWRVPRPAGASLPTIMVADAAMTPSIWAFSTDASYEAACRVHNAAVIDPVAPMRFLEEALVEDDPRVVRLLLDPESDVSLQIRERDLVDLRRLARAVRAERGLAEGDLAAVRAFDAYALPVMPGAAPGGIKIEDKIVAFTAVDSIHAFLAKVPEPARATMDFISPVTHELFTAGARSAGGLLFNPAGPRTFVLEPSMCARIAGA